MKRNLKIVFIVITLIVLVYCSNQMIQKPLWGYLPLPFFLSIYALLILIFEPYFIGNKDRKKLFILSIIGAIILSLGFPPLFTAPLVLLGFIPFLLIEDFVSNKNTVIRKFELFKFTFTGFILWNILTTFWVSNSALAAGFVAIALNALFMCVPFVLFHVVKVKTGTIAGYLSFIVFWISYEYLHHHWELSWPWLTLGNSLAQYPKMVQWYEYTGTTGGTLWILLSNFMLYFSFKSWLNNKKYAIVASISWVLLIAFPIIISINIYNNYQAKGIAQTVEIVQPNFEPHYEKFEVPEKVQLTRFINLSKSMLDSTVDYLVFPETSFESINASSIQSDRNILWLERMVNEYPKLKLVTGTDTYKVYEDAEPKPNTVREKDLVNGDVIYYDNHNSAIQISSGSDSIPLYLKSKFVPGAEIFPYNHLLFFLKPLVDKLGGSTAGLTAQKERSVFSSGTFSVAPIICYESIYSEYCTEYVKKGANALFILTNDGWWDDTPGYRQHLKLGALRAIETRRSIARSANSGCSAFINQLGEIEQPTHYGVQAVIKQKMLFNDEITFYVKHGDIISKIALAITLLMFCFLLYAYRKSFGFSKHVDHH